MTTINTNVYSLNAQRNLAKNSLGLSSALERLSSGLRVNSAKDDAAGLAIGMDMDKAARAISADIRAQSDVISKNQTADGALSVLGDMSLRIAELGKQQGNTNLTKAQADYIGKEISALKTAAGEILTGTKFNDSAIFGAGAGQINISEATDFATSTTVGGSTTISTAVIDATIGKIASARADAGAAINTSEFKIQSLRVNYEAQMAAKGRIMDADFAEETSRLARFQILQQAGTAMISQANAVPQNVLSLLR